MISNDFKDFTLNVKSFAKGFEFDFTLRLKGITELENFKGLQSKE